MFKKDMDLEQSQPIVVAKPTRGREMRTKVIPKEMLNTMQTVSLKKVQGASVVDSLKQPREGDVEIFHEGYIEGKLYLVPDSNLQAMRDIVNLKMKRRRSSTMPLMLQDELSQYHGFKTKLNTLLDKIDKLAESSDEEGEVLAGLDDLTDSTDQKAIEPDEQEKIRKPDEQEKIRKPDELEKMRFSNEDVRNETDKLSKRPNDSFTAEEVIPPILDEKIKYKRVRPKRDKASDMTKHIYRPTDSFNIIVPQLADDRQIKQEMDNIFFDPNNVNSFRFLISGHLRQTTPVFIIHDNYTDSHILRNQSPDFKSHKKDGNIEIFITGKFFTENILTEKTPDSPAVLNIKPDKIVIDNQSSVHRDKFKVVFHVGLADIVLSGEFIRNEATLECIPMLSMEIVKHSSFSKTLNSPQDNMTVLFSGQQQNTPFEDSEIESGRKNKRVHYAKEHEEIIEESKNNEDTSLKAKGLLNRIQQNKYYKNLFVRNKGDSLSKTIPVMPTSSSVRIRSKLNKRGERSKGKLKGRRRKQKERGSKNDIKEGNNYVEVYHAKEDTSPFITAQKTLTAEIKLETQEDGNKKKQSPKIVKRKRVKDKNKAIIENPILAQMQEFFIA